MKIQKKHRKWKGFTILEIVVAMLITGIVLGLGYSGYLLIQKSYVKNQKEQESINDIARLKGILDYSFYKAEKVTWDKESDVLFFDENSSFSFEDSFIVYKYFLNDTLNIKHDKVNVKEVLAVSGETLVDHIELHLAYLDVEMKFDKTYSEYTVTGLSWN